jgi:hypothetical protein
MAITFELPVGMEFRLRGEVPDLDCEARTALALDLFRKEKITHFELGQMLGLNRWETDQFLFENRELAQSLTLDDLESDYRTIKEHSAKPHS